MSNEAIEKALAAEGDLDQLRLFLVDMIASRLTLLQDVLGRWEKAHFKEAIDYLDRNISAAEQPTYAHLRSCYSALSRLMVPPEQRKGSVELEDEAELSYQKLSATVRSLRERIPKI